MKAVGCGWQQGVKFTDIEVTRNEIGKPEVTLSGVVSEFAINLNITKIHISLSHNDDVAIAYAIAVGEG